MIKLAIIEDTEEISKVLQDFFAEDENFEVVLCVPSAEEFWEIQQNREMDIVLCDIGLPQISGIEIVWELKQKRPQVHVVMFTVFEDKEKIFAALQAGASGYLLKNTPLPKIKEGLLEVLDGGASMSPQIALKVIEYFKLSKKNKENFSELTKREAEIVNQLREGFNNKEIAENLFIGAETVKSHIKNIYLKLQVGSRAELYALFKKPL